MPIATASQASSVFWALPLFGLLLFVVAVFRWNRRSKRVTQRRQVDLERDLSQVRDEILMVTTNGVPGARTVKTIGYVEALSDDEAASDWDYRLAEKQALLALARAGLAKGANAIVGLRKSHAHYDPVSYTHLTLPTSDLV